MGQRIQLERTCNRSTTLLNHVLKDLSPGSVIRTWEVVFILVAFKNSFNILFINLLEITLIQAPDYHHLLIWFHHLQMFL
jgi:hypothetical protein